MRSETESRPAPGRRLTVSVGAGLSPTGPMRVGGPGFWDLVETLEEVGYDSLWLSDSGHRGGLAPLPALAAVAARTDRLKLGTSVLVLPPRNPVLLARELATVDVLSGGRLLPAGGLGAKLPAELEAMGVPRGERTARLEEAVRILRALWGGGPVTMEGRFHRLSEVTLDPPPADPRLELWLGGRAPAALRRIGRIADGWLASFVGPEELAAGVETIRGAAAEAGRSIDEDHYGTILYTAPSADSVPEEAAGFLGRRRDMERSEHLALGVDGTREMLEQFIAAGATKFVLMPVGEDPAGWLRELRPGAVEPLERRGAFR